MLPSESRCLDSPWTWNSTCDSLPSRCSIHLYILLWPCQSEVNHLACSTNYTLNHSWSLWPYYDHHRDYVPVVPGYGWHAKAKSPRSWKEEVGQYILEEGNDYGPPPPLTLLQLHLHPPIPHRPLCAQLSTVQAQLLFVLYHAACTCSMKPHPIETNHKHLNHAWISDHNSRPRYPKIEFQQYQTHASLDKGNPRQGLPPFHSK